MAYHSVAEILEAIDETRSRVSKRVEGLSSAQAKFRPSPDAWSIAEIVEHLSLMEGRMSRLIAMMAKKGESAGAPEAQAADRTLRPVDLDRFVERSLREKYIAPETVSPSGNVSIADSLERMRRSRAELHELRTKLETMDLSGVTYPHPTFGPFDIYQWLAFVGVHEDRHLRQIEAAMSSPEFA